MWGGLWSAAGEAHRIWDVPMCEVGMLWCTTDHNIPSQISEHYQKKTKV